MIGTQISCLRRWGTACTFLPSHVRFLSQHGKGEQRTSSHDHMKNQSHHNNNNNNSNERLVARTSETAGINGLYGNRAQNAIRGMLGPQGQADARESKAVPILGRATVQGTKYTCDRSTVFENWRHVCADPVGWHLSKLGSATCKMPNDVNEAVESLQLQIIKGCNVFELDGSLSDVHQSIARAFYEALQAFELEREGFVMVFRCGVIKQQPFQEEVTQVETSNTAVVRNRIVPIFERYKASSLPSMQLKTGFRISDLSDEQLSRLNLRRVSKTSAAGLSPDWLEAFFTNVAYNTKLECIDVLLLDGFHTLFDGRPREHIDDDILQLFAYLENQVKLGVLQYYGISSPYLAPHIHRDFPELPPDAMVPDHIRHRRPLPAVINLYHVLELARRAGGDKHHFRFVQYPFNLTFSQALDKPLPYDGNHTLRSLTQALGLTTLGYSPLEATDLMELPQRYHNFPMEADLKSLRMNFFTVCERCVLKEMEVKESIEKGPSTVPPLEHLFVASVYLAAQRQFTNLFFFTSWATYYMIPRFRRALMRFKEASSTDLKEWCKQYEQLVNDMLRLRKRMFEHKAGKFALEKNFAIDRVSPTLSMCPMLNQKAINFATYGCDTVLAGFHVSRYFHEATELNPARNGELVIPESELQALCTSMEVSYANSSPPDPYMLEPIVTEGKLSRQRSKSMEFMVKIDPHNPKFPDIPEELGEEGETEKKSNSNNNNTTNKV
ncbi:aldo/keto reductase [Trypanosoma theileri]|uniref:Aldo/keto reductase n=1 Tax=Trypanosoma theileri TaxID=67003 RepID=A0A1X0NTZ9_9TRYP|nr:aldo/keto reductase [Trypanosoma theileri]ORC87580.1 aldo/keto reductase [Trypanosoma theileri]